jgi:hypothetical protein
MRFVSSLPPIILSLILDEGKATNHDDKYAILTSNGIAWEISGCLKKKEGPGSQQPTANPAGMPTTALQSADSQMNKFIQSKQVQVSTLFNFLIHH